MMFVEINSSTFKKLWSHPIIIILHSYQYIKNYPYKGVHIIVLNDQSYVCIINYANCVYGSCILYIETMHVWIKIIKYEVERKKNNTQHFFAKSKWRNIYFD